MDLKLANHPTIAAMNSSIASTNNATLATVATTYALKSVADQLAIDVAARQTAADVDQRVATALLPYLTQTAYQAGQALQDARLDGHDAEILALQNAGPFATAGDLSNLQVTLQSAIDGILAEIATLGGATNLVNAPAWLGNVTWDLLAGTNQIRNLHATGPLSIALANDDWTLSFSCDAYTTQQTDDAIAAALTNYFTRAEVTATIVAAIDESKGYTDTQLADYSTTAQTTQAIADALVPYGTAGQRETPPSRQPSRATTPAQTDAAIAAAALSNGQSWTGGPTFNLLRNSNVLRNLSVAGALTASFQNLDDTILIESDSYARSETYTQAETGAAITAAIDALDLSQFQNEAEVRPPLTGGAILGNGSVIEIEADCWSKAQSDGRYPLVATFNSLGSTVTSIDGRVTALENAPGMAPTADLTVNSLTATSFVQTPLQSAAADLQIRNATTTLRAEDGTLLASFAAGSIGLEQDITVRSDRTLNATTADFAQLFVGSTAATGAFTSSSSITATQQIETDLRVQAPLLRCDPAASVLTVTGGTQGVLVDDTLRVNGVIAPDASLPFLSLSGGSSGVQVLSPLLEQIAAVPNSSSGLVVRNAADTGDATLILDSNAQNGVVELKALAGG